MAVLNAIGPAVLDRHVVGPFVGAGDKRDCQLRTSLGGGCVNSMRAAARQSAPTSLQRRLLLMKGPDATGEQLVEMARGESIADVHSLDLLECSRESILLEGQCFTVRPPLRHTPLAPAIVMMLREADWTIVAPLGASDADLIGLILENSQHTLLQLSAAQLSDAGASAALARQATWAVMNEAEFKHWTGAPTLAAGRHWLRDREIGGVLVTSADGVAVFEANRLDFHPSFRLPPEQVRQTVGAGDCFVGAMAASLSTGAVLADAIAAGQRVAAQHLLGSAAFPMAPAIEPISESMCALPAQQR